MLSGEEIEGTRNKQLSLGFPFKEEETVICKSNFKLVKDFLNETEKWKNATIVELMSLVEVPIPELTTDNLRDEMDDLLKAAKDIYNRYADTNGVINLCDGSCVFDEDKECKFDNVNIDIKELSKTLDEILDVGLQLEKRKDLARGVLIFYNAEFTNLCRFRANLSMLSSNHSNWEKEHKLRENAQHTWRMFNSIFS